MVGSIRFTFHLSPTLYLSNLHSVPASVDIAGTPMMKFLSEDMTSEKEVFVKNRQRDRKVRVKRR